MIRRVVGIVMLCVFLIPIGLKVGVYVSFEINQDYIAAELCENKDKPEMHCDGKCYLAKQIELTENKETDKEAPKEVEHVPSPLLFFENIRFSVMFSAVSLEKVEHHFKPQFNVSTSHLSAVFHPPEFSLNFLS